MKAETWSRLLRLEAQQSQSGADKSASKQFKFKMAVMSIVAFHAGELTPKDSLATALARALHITDCELKTALNPENRDRLDIWALVLERLNNLASARGAQPVAETSSLILERSLENDDRRDGFLEVLDELYEEIPMAVKERHCLLPHLVHYFP
jgi:hypothetical protein